MASSCHMCKVRCVMLAALSILHGHVVARGVAARRGRNLAGGRAAHRALVGVAARRGADPAFHT